MNTLNAKTMFVFPGQGSQYRSMGSDIHQEFRVVRSIYDKASEIVGWDVAELSFNGPEEKLGSTEFTQVALLTHSISCLEVFREITENKITPSVTAGHSIGEYAALVAAGALTFEKALKLVQKRGELMGAYGRGKMVALSLDLDTVREFVNSFYCEVGGCNLPDQTVVGGTKEDLNLLVEYAKSKYRTRAFYLKTGGAFHTYLMIDAARKFRPILDSTDLVPPKVNVLSNYTGRYHSVDASTIKALLFFQLFNPVKWIWGMLQALNDGVNLVIEFGGGIGNGETADQKRPNLESITKKTIIKSGNGAIYLPAINLVTIKETAQFLSSLERIVEEPNDESGNAVDENWFHLFVPVRNGIVTENSVGLIRLVGELGLGEVVQLIPVSADKLQELTGHIIEGSEDAQPCLEMFAGCESAALVHYRGIEIRNELIKLRKRMEHPGYGHKAISQSI